MKLHLGCGQNHLDGYVNIDFPPSEHTVQEKSVADEYHNILELNYKKRSVDEVRLHHTFEHFTRPVAYALLTSWSSWLKPGGIVHIEVPDFDRTALNVLNPLTDQRERGVGLRHIFGSNEADWAVHYEGWSPKRLKGCLEHFGFEPVEQMKNSYKGTFNCEVRARKIKELSKNEASQLARSYLSNFLVDDSPFEMKLLDVWMSDYKKQAEKTWAR